MTWMKDAEEKGRVTPESRELGQHIARMADKAAARLESEGEPDERCASCAFRSGTAPNQCADTLMDALKCIVEHEPFYCHVKKGWPCHGWFAAAVATKGMPPVAAPWPYSHDEATGESALRRMSEIDKSIGEAP